MSGIAIVIEGVDFSAKNIGQVTLQDVDVELTGITINAEESYVNNGKLTVGYIPSGVVAAKRGVTWSIESGENLGTIDENGNLTVLGAGEMTIRATSIYDPTISATATFSVSSTMIHFADNNVKAICVANYDTNEDGEISAEEAAGVSLIGDSVFRGNTSIQYFNELVNFTNAKLKCYGQQGTFAKCSGLKEVTLPVGAQAADLTYGFAYMFNECSALTSIGNIENLNTTGAKSLSCMFNKTSKLVGTLDLHNWNVSSVINCSQIFSNARVSVIDISGWTLGSNCDCNYMFQQNPNLTTINFGTFDFSKITKVYNMFSGSSGLANITGTISGINVALDMVACPLTQDSVLVIFNGLKDLTGGTAKSITLKKAVYDAIDETTMAIATGKNWTVVRGNY